METNHFIELQAYQTPINDLDVTPTPQNLPQKLPQKKRTRCKRSYSEVNLTHGRESDNKGFDKCSIASAPPGRRASIFSDSQEENEYDDLKTKKLTPLTPLAPKRRSVATQKNNTDRRIYLGAGMVVVIIFLSIFLLAPTKKTPLPAELNIKIKQKGRDTSVSSFFWNFIAWIDVIPVNQSICLIFNNLTIHFNSSHRDQNFTLACRNTDEFLPEKTQAFQTTSPTCNPSISNQKFITIIPNWKEPLSCTDSPTTAPPEPNPFLWINLGAVESYDRILVTAWSNSTYPPTERSIRIIGSTVTQGIIISEIWTWGELLNNNSFFFMQSPMDGPITFNPIQDALITPNPYSANNKHMLFFEPSSAQSLSSFNETTPLIGGLISFAFLALVCLYRLLRVNDLSYHDQNDAQPTPSFRA